MRCRAADSRYAAYTLPVPRPAARPERSRPTPAPRPPRAPRGFAPGWRSWRGRRRFIRRDRVTTRAIAHYLHTGNPFQHRDERGDVVRPERAGDFLRTQRRATNIDAPHVVAIELFGHFAKRAMLEHQLALHPGCRFREIDAMLESARPAAVDDHAVS